MNRLKNKPPEPFLYLETLGDELHFITEFAVTPRMISSLCEFVRSECSTYSFSCLECKASHPGFLHFVFTLDLPF